MAAFRTALTAIYILLAISLVLPIFVLHAWLTGSPELLYAVAMRAVRLILKIAGVRLRIEGLENIPAGVCIFAANHVSNIDPPALVPSIPRRVAILVKKELFHVPFLAAAMRAADFVPVDRGDKESAAASVDLAIERLRAGRSFLVYPEGTRSPDGRLKPFKSGGFVMAIQAGVPVVPVSLAGPQHLMRKGEWVVRPGEILVRFGQPVDAGKYSLEERDALRDRVRSLVAAGLPPDQQPV